MTSEVEALKTNEFLRRRKLRIQQVREQSKDIAKKIRQRAEIEKFRHLTEHDAKKRKEYQKQQDKLVQGLEQFCARSVQNVGSSHKNAEKVNVEEVPTKSDLSRQRAKKASLELKRKKQEHLDNQKKLLDRRLQAREAANEISREKSSSVASKLLAKSSTKENAVENEAALITDKSITEDVNDKEEPAILTNEMATQWNFDSVPHEWEPHIPVLSFRKENSDSAKGTSAQNVEEPKRRPNLFAVSEEMPSSLRGGITNQDATSSYKPSLNLVSEYLLNRELRLREHNTVTVNKKPDDLQSIKQTLQKTRTAMIEGSYCHVADVQLVPVPSWQPENCGFCFHNVACQKQSTKCSNHSKNPQTRAFKDRVMKQIFSSRHVQPDLNPSPVLRGSSPFRRCKVVPRHFSAKPSLERRSEMPIKLGQPMDVVNKKNSVTMYNHATRDTRDVLYGDKRIVFRGPQTDEDAYSQAMKESSLDSRRVLPCTNDSQRKMRDSRSKIALTKQNVEKEFKDTMAFLNSLPKDKSKPIKTAYKDESRQELQKEIRQKTLQQEYKKIEKECKRHPFAKTSKSFSPSKDKPMSPPLPDLADNFDAKDFQYSWMPVPESDGNFAIHTIPTTLKENKSGNTVKFSQVDSYHEYRSRHKHTPPTKDSATYDKPKRVVEAVVIEQTEQDEFLSSSSGSSFDETSNDDDVDDFHKIKPKTKRERNDRLSDAERIIIYKILNSKADKKSKTNKTTSKKIAGVLDNKDATEAVVEKIQSSRSTRKLKNNSFEQLNEGVYKTINEKRDNIASMYFPDEIAADDKIVEGCGQSTCYLKRMKNTTQIDTGIGVSKECGNEGPNTRDVGEQKCKCATKPKDNKCMETNPSTCTSTSSFQTATNDKKTGLADDGFIKLLDKEGQDAGKFYIGATGFLKNDDYEVIIQLRKKDTIKQDENITSLRCAADEKPERTETPEHGIQSVGNPPVPLPKSTCEDETTSDKIIKTFSAPHNSHSYQSSGIGTSSHGTCTEVIDQTGVCSAEPAAIIVPPEQTKSSKTFVETGTYMAFDDCSLILNKAETVAKQAMSTCTQTSFDSPAQRPMFIHMSSTTSTAYMSPPELIIPTFLKPEMPLNTNNLTSRSPRTRIIDRGEAHACTCRKCNRSKKKIMTKINQSINKLTASPQTANSTSDNGRELFGIRRKKPQFAHCKKNSARFESDRSPRVISQVHTCRTQYINRGLRNEETKATKIKSKMSSVYDRKKSSKHDLNPLVKWYVNKLLNLNKDGLRAIDIANQECSAVTTPGSSIVDMSCNIDHNVSRVNNNISLEQLKQAITQQVLENYKLSQKNTAESKDCNNNEKKRSRITNKKAVHKVKSLNISKHLIKMKSINSKKPNLNVILVEPDCSKTPVIESLDRKSSIRLRSKSSPSPRAPDDNTLKRKNKSSENINTQDCIKSIKGHNKTTNFKSDDVDALLTKYRTEIDNKSKNRKEIDEKTSHVPRSTSKCKKSINSTEVAQTTGKSGVMSSNSGVTQPQEVPQLPLNISTQTLETLDEEIHFIKMAEDKLQNMEKIADLTEICTKRLSNLAKVLEEVRRNKSLAYNQVSSSESETDQRSEKSPDNLPRTYEPFVEVKVGRKTASPPVEQQSDETNQNNSSSSLLFIPFLKDIPRPDASKISQRSCHPQTINEPETSSQITSAVEVNNNNNNKSRGRPPPALSRKNLKHSHDVVPHELSTVMEVDSPLSSKVKNQSLHNDKVIAPVSSKKTQSILVGKKDTLGAVTESAASNNDEQHGDVLVKEQIANPDLLQSNVNTSERMPKPISAESYDDSNMPMMDMNKFNEIMLKPFISVHEYAKQCNPGNALLEDGSNLGDVPKDDAINDDLSSLHSDGSLPDVIAELLKRNIISEPFKFDTVSNANSTTVSSESTLSMLALSKVCKDNKKKSSAMFQNKENIAETSDTLSISSNPDLENAFKKLGIGWASSTLKKTKERLALSSSSNTSSSSLTQFKLKGNSNHDVPVIVKVTDSVSLVHSIQRKPLQGKTVTDSGKNAEQQTSLTNSMTVKQFLTNELANKITFTNKTDDTEDYVSLYETKLPEEMKHLSKLVRATTEQSMDSAPSGSNNRARTSTPVQIYKSMTYHSSSSSNVSNGLFSNADLSSVKGTSNSQKNHSTTDKDDLTVPNYSLRTKKGLSDYSE